jgi:hypothetical protein
MGSVSERKRPRDAMMISSRCQLHLDAIARLASATVASGESMIACCSAPDAGVTASYKKRTMTCESMVYESSIIQFSGRIFRCPFLGDWKNAIHNSQSITGIQPLRRGS